ncbi:GvpL/GvpF family gas vesicle protein [Streptomyces sp. VRA16 Mangrove soil]|uniref:GvpL/GvpF family gas vesicle protein n=1 Tax=Streptomyces sp. VRA16 Mangrove soil TaxID=2817434 RepID=UPI001A9CBE12|nr:GvpL/GvpF family gas vesicle protein [Streptomyces sp. VRA16 Mangrove soil]MBO1330256.1 GvpL/GvpF family gas vesicle protein [Streptomyces sp. VRA16 Mangrove soil]
MTELRYVYAVCGSLDAPLPAQLTGVAGAVPRLVRHAGLTAVVSHVPPDQFSESALRRNLENLDWLSDTARAHQTVIAALASVTSPLPMRLATVFHDDSGVRTMLETQADGFRATLSRLDGRVEWGVKVYVEAEPEETREARGGAPRERPSANAAAAGSGRDYLRRRRAERAGRDEVWRRAEGFAQDLHDRLTRRAEEARLHPPQNSELSGASGRNVLNAAYLVDRSASEEFVERVDAVKDGQPGLRVELTGPWAAYSFCAPPEERSGPSAPPAPAPEGEPS